QLRAFGEVDLRQRRGRVVRAAAAGEEQQGCELSVSPVRSVRHDVLLHKRALAMTASERPGKGYWKRSCCVRSSRRFLASTSTHSGPTTRIPAPAFSSTRPGRSAVPNAFRAIDETTSVSR